MTREPFETGEFELRRVLRDLREGSPAPALARERLRGALRLATVSAPFAPRRGPTHPRTLERLSGVATRSGALWLLGGVGATAVVVALMLAARGRAPSVLSQRPLPMSVDKGQARNAESMLSPAKPQAMAESPPLATAAPALASEPKAEKRAGRDTSLAAERRLLDAARAALVGGDTEAGRERLARHARQFPHGALAEEREALSVDALVAAGRYDEARRRADAFRARYPQSLFAPSVTAAVQAIP